MGTFAVGVATGLFASWVFGVVTRLFRVRYRVRVGDPVLVPSLAGNAWEVPVTITLPRIQGALMTPLVEYLEPYIGMGVNPTALARSTWEEGDIGSARLRADGDMTIGVQVGFEPGGGGLYIAKRYAAGSLRPDIAEDGDHVLHALVRRSKDGSIAAGAQLRVRRSGSVTTMGVTRRY